MDFSDIYTWASTTPLLAPSSINIRTSEMLPNLTFLKFRIFVIAFPYSELYTHPLSFYNKKPWLKLIFSI